MMCQPRQKSWPGRNTKPAQQPAERIPRHEIRGLPEDPLPHEKAEWADQKTPFKLSFYHQGMHFDTPVKINEVTADNVEEIKYDPSRFDFGDVKFDPKATEQLGYAGFRVLYPINKADKQDEIMTMLAPATSASSARANYGLSARGLAIDTALPSGEEFPRFTEFWIERRSRATSTW
jgi:glucans biosynthesis protein